jgi:hypothetical protein
VESLIQGKEDSQGNINYEDFVKMVLAQWSNSSSRPVWNPFAVLL